MLINKFWVCDCFGHGLRVVYDSDDKIEMFYLSLWDDKFNDNRSWRERLRAIWRIIRWGHPFEDEIILTQEEGRRLGRFLLSPPSVESCGGE